MPRNRELVRFGFFRAPTSASIAAGAMTTLICCDATTDDFCFSHIDDAGRWMLPSGFVEASSSCDRGQLVRLNARSWRHVSLGM